MKRILLILFICGFAQYAMGQVGNGLKKGKNKSVSPPVDKVKKEEKKNDDSDYTFGKLDRSIPEKVEEAFKMDYPNAIHPVWGKLKSEWTVTFGNGMFRSIATYHANGERRDTRTHLFVQQAPKPVMDEIVKRYPIFKQKRVILKLEEPGRPEIYNINVTEGGKTISMSFDGKGKEIK